MMDTDANMEVTISKGVPEAGPSSNGVDRMEVTNPMDTSSDDKFDDVRGLLQTSPGRDLAVEMDWDVINKKRNHILLMGEHMVKQRIKDLSGEVGSGVRPCMERKMG